jgi:CRP-like cAMP-binding protein
MSSHDDRTIIPTQRMQLRAALERMDLFEGIEPDLLDDIQSQFRVVEVDAGTVVVRQGDDSSDLYVVDKGEFDVTAAVGGQSRFLGKLNPGEFFGEIAILRRSPRTATVTAQSAGRLWTLTADAFTTWLERSPETSRRVHATMRRRETANALRALQ